jgi:hypothetical protein
VYAEIAHLRSGPSYIITVLAFKGLHVIPHPEDDGWILGQDLIDPSVLLVLFILPIREHTPGPEDTERTWATLNWGARYLRKN